MTASQFLLPALCWGFLTAAAAFLVTLHLVPLRTHLVTIGVAFLVATLGSFWLPLYACQTLGPPGHSMAEDFPRFIICASTYITTVEILLFRYRNSLKRKSPSA